MIAKKKKKRGQGNVRAAFQWPMVVRVFFNFAYREEHVQDKRLSHRSVVSCNRCLFKPNVFLHDIRKRKKNKQKCWLWGYDDQVDWRWIWYQRLCLLVDGNAKQRWTLAALSVSVWLGAPLLLPVDSFSKITDSWERWGIPVGLEWPLPSSSSSPSHERINLCCFFYPEWMQTKG